MPVEAVTFDVGGTLIQPWPSVGHIYAEVAARHGIQNVAAETLNARFKIAWRARNRFNHSRTGWSQLVDEVFAGLTREPPSRTFFSELYERFAQQDAWQVFDDVPPTLDALSHRGIRLGIISNWDERLQELLRQLRLATRFEIIIVSCEAAAAKPDAAIFHQAATQFNLPPAFILHVGDGLEMDLQGAEAAGFQARLIQRHPEKSHSRALLRLTDLITEIVGPKPKTDKSP